MERLSSFRLWLEKSDYELSKELVFDAAGVSDDDESLTIPVTSITGLSDKLLTMGVIKSNREIRDEVRDFIQNATHETTLNDLIQKLSELFGGGDEEEDPSETIPTEPTEPI